MLKIIKLGMGNGYSIPSLDLKRLPVKQIGNIIRERGCDVEIKTMEDIDMTLETLFRVAFNDILPPTFSEEKVQYLVELMSYDSLYHVIENGGIVNYVNRKMRGGLCE